MTAREAYTELHHWVGHDLAKTFGDLAEAYRAQSNGPAGKVAIQLDW